LEPPRELEDVLDDIRRESKSPDSPDVVVLRLAIRHSWGRLRECLLQLQQEPDGEEASPLLALVADVQRSTSEQSVLSVDRATVDRDERTLALYALGLPRDEDKRRASVALDSLHPTVIDYDGVLARTLEHAMTTEIGSSGGGATRCELLKIVLGILLKQGKIDSTEFDAFIASAPERPRFRPFVPGH
jgi:hypothetical protein